MYVGEGPKYTIQKKYPWFPKAGPGPGYYEPWEADERRPIEGRGFVGRPHEKEIEQDHRDYLELNDRLEEPHDSWFTIRKRAAEPKELDIPGPG